MDPSYPLPLKLNGSDLPWVLHGTHLGQEFHQLCDMEYDTKTKRAHYIQIQETFSFANPPELIKAIQTYAGHWYGSMLWNLSRDLACQIYRSWSTSVKEV